MLQVDVVTEARGLDSLRDEWSSLSRRCPTATIFQTFEWIYQWWLHIGRVRIDRKLYVITVRDDGQQLVGLAPFVLSQWHGTPLRRLSFMGTGVSDYNDVIAADGFGAEVCATIYRHLAVSSVWQIGDFAHLREGGLWRSQPPVTSAGINYSDFNLEKCPYLPYPPLGQPDRWAGLTKNYSKKMRAHIGYYERRLKGIFEVENGILEDPAELDDALDALFELHRRRWNKRWLPGVLGGRQIQDFHRSVAKEFLANGWLRLHYLMLDGDYQAVLYCFAFRDRTCYYQGGFEPTLARHSLGSVLTATAIQKSIAEDREEFDFLRGDEPYKERWTQGQTRMNIRRLAAKGGAPYLDWAERAHGIEHAIETRFKEYMHHAYSKGPTKTSAVENKEGVAHLDSDS